MTKIAALYVETNGCYFDLPNIDPWDEQRDARQYTGPYPVIAHPPCKRWGRYWSGGPSANVRRNLGDDNGCFDRALWAVRTFGGVLEHPEASKAWDWFGLHRPRKTGGWGFHMDSHGGRTCCVEQGHYGHAAKKATWLYFVGPQPQELAWGSCGGKRRIDPGFHSSEERANATDEQRLVRRLSRKERMWTPEPFRDLLIAMVKG